MGQVYRGVWILVWTQFAKQQWDKVECVRVKRENLGFGTTGVGDGLGDGYKDFGLQLEE